MEITELKRTVKNGTMTCLQSLRKFIVTSYGPAVQFGLNMPMADICDKRQELEVPHGK